MPIKTNHRKTIGSGSQDTNVYSLVLSRLLFLVDDADNNPSPNADKISDVTWEVMVWLNQCFRFEDADIGIEDNYTQLQLQAIADIVAYQLLLYRAIALGAGVNGYDITNTSSNPQGLFLKRAESDETVVEYGQLSTKDNSYHGGINIASLMDMLYKSVCKTLALYDCYICRCSDCTLSLEMLRSGEGLPFRIIGC